MKIVDPEVEIIHEENPLRRIELCGRVCYKSEGKITEDSAGKFVAGLIERGHTSVLEHARVIVPEYSVKPLLLKAQSPGNRLPYGADYRNHWVLGRCPGYDYYALNCRDFCAIGGTPDELETLKNADDYMTVRFTCDRAIANELVRHRVFSFSQESTRYVNYEKNGLAFVRPLPFEWAEQSEDQSELSDCMADPRFQAWVLGCEQAEANYLHLIREGCHPQEARAVLPLSVKTELIMTGTFPQWSEMLKLRLHHSAHPQMRYLMQMLIAKEDFPSSGIQLPGKEEK